MNIAELIKLAEAAAQIASVIARNIEMGKVAANADDLATLRAILDPLHAENLAASAKLDELLAGASAG